MGENSLNGLIFKIKKLQKIMSKITNNLTFILGNDNAIYKDTVIKDALQLIENTYNYIEEDKVYLSNLIERNQTIKKEVFDIVEQLYYDDIVTVSDKSMIFIIANGMKFIQRSTKDGLKYQILDMVNTEDKYKEIENSYLLKIIYEQFKIEFDAYKIG
jgi:hypothetical protein